MKLSPEEIESIALLARLKLSPEEKQRYAEQLSVVLEYVEILNEVKTDGVEETCQVTGLEDVFRDDVVLPYDEDARRALVACFPEKKGDLLQVKAVFTDNG